MTPAGYIAKQIHSSTEWLGDVAVEDIWSVSNCISDVFCDYIPHWRHNGFWLFDSPQAVHSLAAQAKVDLSGYQLFYYEIYDYEYYEDTKTWEAFGPEALLKTCVEVPAVKQLAGYDVVSFSTLSAPECSPLSCNRLARSIAVNKHCLLGSLEQAKQLLEEGAFSNSEPGPYRIFAVYTCPPA